MRAITILGRYQVYNYPTLCMDHVSVERSSHMALRFHCCDPQKTSHKCKSEKLPWSLILFTQFADEL